MTDSIRRCGGIAKLDVSIVIPCFNGHAFLSQAVESALRQDLESKEVIVIDDGSTAPETAEVLARLPRGVKVIRQENRGVAAARNRGFEAARGRYVLPLDCDDWIEPDYACRAFTLIAGREDAFVYSWTDIFGESKVVLRRRWDPFEQLFLNKIECCILVPKVFWCRVGGYDETMQLGLEDWDFNIRLGLAGGEGLCLPEPLFHYRQSTIGMWQSVTHQRYGILWRRMQKKYPDVYSMRGLLARARARPKEERGHGTWVLLAFYGAHRVLPDLLFTLLLRSISFYGHMRRQHARMRGTPSHGR